ncbi:hypothetical protein ACP4OV_026817 [Aristida adscensionis]
MASTSFIRRPVAYNRRIASTNLQASEATGVEQAAESLVSLNIISSCRNAISTWKAKAPIYPCVFTIAIVNLTLHSLATIASCYSFSVDNECLSLFTAFGFLLYGGR